jgi:beta-lactamase class A
MEPRQIEQLLETLGGKYAFYVHRHGAASIFIANARRFTAASIIKLPILLSWAVLERQGAVDLNELCDLDAAEQVRGAGFARRMRARRLPYHDVLLMMMATSDNLCTNLIIQRVGLERLNQLFHNELGLVDSEIQRKLMDFAARERGLDNWIGAQDCVDLFDLFHGLPAAQRAWVEPMLLECQDANLLLRQIARDTLHFYHKTGSIAHVLHDWGFTRDCDLFLLTENFTDEVATGEVFGRLGQLLLTGRDD